MQNEAIAWMIGGFDCLLDNIDVWTEQRKICYCNPNFLRALIKQNQTFICSFMQISFSYEFSKHQNIANFSVWSWWKLSFFDGFGAFFRHSLQVILSSDALELTFWKWKKNRWSFCIARFTFTVKKFLETPLRDHCCDLKGTPRGFQKQIFKKILMWKFEFLAHSVIFEGFMLKMNGFLCYFYSHFTKIGSKCFKIE